MIWQTLVWGIDNPRQNTFWDCNQYHCSLNPRGNDLFTALLLVFKCKWNNWWKVRNAQAGLYMWTITITTNNLAVLLQITITAYIRIKFFFDRAYGWINNYYILNETKHVLVMNEACVAVIFAFKWLHNFVKALDEILKTSKLIWCLFWAVWNH